VTALEEMEEMMIGSSVKECIKSKWRFIWWFLYAKKGKSWACFKACGGLGLGHEKKISI
jgi:hypothetical protein